MKFEVTCCECGHTVYHNFGTGKQAERNYEYRKDSFVCDDCREKAREAKYAAKKAADEAEKLAAGWKQINVHYSVYKNEYQNKRNAAGEMVKKGEYHAEDKTIDLLVPADLLRPEDQDIADEPAEEPSTEETTAPLACENTEKSAPAKKSANGWHGFSVNSCFIVARSKKTGAVKVRMPERSEYAGYSFWHPAKCFNEYPCDNRLRYSDNWTFKLSANGGELKKELSAAELLAATDNGLDFASYEKASETHTPLPLKAVECAALEELVDND